MEFDCSIDNYDAVMMMSTTYICIIKRSQNNLELLGQLSLNRPGFATQKTFLGSDRKQIGCAADIIGNK